MAICSWLFSILQQQNLEELPVGLKHFFQAMSIEKQMINFINIARQNPSYFIPILEKQIASFTNDREIPLTQQIIYETNQGKNAWIEALNFLKMQKTLDPLQQHQGLNSSARDHAYDLCNNNIFGHTGSDGSNFSERILRYCRKGPGSMAELIGADFAYENRNHAELTILGLIIDDGVPDRGHRKTIFNPLYRQIGCKSQSQGEKLISVFNITENKLILRTSSTVENSSVISSSGMKFAQKQGNDVMRNTTNQMMKNTKNSLSPYQTVTEDRFAKTEWTPESFHQKKKEATMDKPGKESRQMKENKPVHVSKIKHTSSSSDQFGSATQGRSGLKGGSLMGRKLREKKESSKTYYEEGSKITEVTTKLVYTDGTVEEKTERHTVYLQQ